MKTARRVAPRYLLDEQIGFVLRLVTQRHASIFLACIGEDLTPTQWAALSKLDQIGAVSQNLLGRLTAMDGATIKGVVSRLSKRGFVTTSPDAEDGRMLSVALTPKGRDIVQALAGRALEISRETLSPLKPDEQAQLRALLERLR